MLGQFLDGSPFRFKRHCYSREDYEDAKASCEADDPTECVVAMCDTSGCKAQLITSGIYSEGTANPGQTFQDTSHFLTVKWSFFR